MKTDIKMQFRSNSEYSVQQIIVHFYNSTQKKHNCKNRINFKCDQCKTKAKSVTC